MPDPNDPIPLPGAASAPVLQGPKPVTRKSGKMPVYASNQTDLGRYLMPPRDRKIIQRLMKLEDCPGRSPDGKYHVGNWQVFVNANVASADRTATPDKLKLEMEKLRLQNDKLLFELQVKRKDYTENALVEQYVGQMVMQAKQQLQSLRSSLPPQLAGLDEVAIEKRLAEEIAVVLSRLSAKPLG
mgnify:FL=1